MIEKFSYLQIMSEDQLRTNILNQHLHHMVSSEPVVMVSSKPPLGKVLLIVCLDVILISGK